MSRSSAVFFFILACGLMVSSGLAQRPELVYQIGHSAPINSVAISPDGKFALSGSGDATIKLWELESGRLIRTFWGHKRAIEEVKFSPDGKSILSASYEGIHLWETVSGTLLKTFEEPKTSCIAFSPNGQYFISGNRDNTIKIWNIQTGGQLIRELLQDERKAEKNKKGFRAGHKGGVTSITYSADGKYIFSGDGAGYIILWEAATGNIEKLYRAHNARITSVDLSPDNRFGLIGASNLGYKSVELATGLNKIGAPDSSIEVSTVKFSSDGKYYLAATYSGVIEIGQAQNLRRIETLKLQWEDISVRILNTKGFLSASFTTDNQFILTGGNDLLLWKINSGKIIHHFGSSQSRIEQAIYSSTEQSIVFVADNYVLKQMDLSKKQLFSFPNSSNPINTISLSPDGHSVLTGRKGAIDLWSLEKNQMLHSFSSHQNYTLATAFSLDGIFVYSLSDTLLNIWDLKNNQLNNEIEVNFKPVGEIVISFPDFNLNRGRKTLFSPNANFILADTSITQLHNYFRNKYIEKSGLNLWNISSGKRTKLFNKWHSGMISTIAFSHDGLQAASGGDDKKIKLWDINSGKEFRTLSDHSDVITALQFSPNGKSILSGAAGKDNTIKLWNISNGKLLKTFTGHQAGINSISFAADGKTFISASWDNTIKLWNIEKETELATFFFFEGTDWIMITPDGRFDGTPQRLNDLYYVQGSDIIPVNAFFEKFYAPGLMKEVLSDTTGNRLQSEMASVPIIKLPPLVEIVTPKNQQTLQTSNTKIQIQATAQGGGIDEIRLYQNGKLVKQTAKGFGSNLQAGKPVITEFDVTLVAGNNKFRAVAYNNERVEAVPAIVTVEYSVPTPQGDLYVLAIGINEYKNTNYNVDFAKPNVEKIKEFFQNQKKIIYKNIIIKEIYDQKANRQNVIASMMDLSEKIQPEDVFIFAFAGHGAMTLNEDPAQSKYYLALHAVSQLNDESSLLTAGISTTELVDYLRNIKAQKQLLILDACQTTRWANEFTFGRMTPEKALIQLARDTGIMVLASTANMQQSAEFAELGQTLLTHTIVSGLNGDADSVEGDGMISVKELAHYLNEAFPELSQKYWGIIQYPTCWIPSVDFPLGVAIK